MSTQQPAKPTKKSRKQEVSAARKVRQQQALQREARRRRQMIIISAVAGIAIVAVFALILFNQDDSSGLPAVAAAPEPITAPANGLSLGNPDAPLKIVEYGDYQCPYCADFQENGFPPLLEEFINTGDVFFTYVPMSFLGDESVTAAEAALCANDQGQFWAMHESIYNNHFGENQGAYSRDRLDAMAEKIGLDMEAFKSCMDNGDQRDAVADYAAAADLNGIKSTPRLVVGDLAPAGWTNWGSLQAVILAELGR